MPRRKFPKSFFNVTNEIRYTLKEIIEKAEEIDKRLLDDAIYIYRELFKSYKNSYSSHNENLS